MFVEALPSGGRCDESMDVRVDSKWSSAEFNVGAQDSDWRGTVSRASENRRNGTCQMIIRTLPFFDSLAMFEFNPYPPDMVSRNIPTTYHLKVRISLPSPDPRASRRLEDACRGQRYPVTCGQVSPPAWMHGWVDASTSHMDAWWCMYVIVCL